MTLPPPGGPVPPGGRVPAVTVVGEALADLLPAAPAGGPAADAPTLAFRAVPGGGPANVAVGLRRLGVPVAFAGRFPRTGLGPWRRRRLEAEGVDLTPSTVAAEPLTLAVVTVDPAGVPAYEFYGPETADWHWRPEELPPPASLAGGVVHTGSLAAALAPALLPWAARLRARGDVLVSYDANIRPSILGSPERCLVAAEPWLALAHLVKVSEEDVDAMHPGADPEEVAAGWLAAEPGPDLVVVTRGPEGAVALHRDGRRRAVPAPAVTVADTVGAGDAFTAGLLAALWSAGRASPAGVGSLPEADLAAALDHAVLVAAITCTRPGADPPSAADLRAAEG